MSSPPTPNQRCSKCGAALTAGSLEDLCPACMLEAGLSAQASTIEEANSGMPVDAPAPLSTGVRIGRYKILQELGEGGCGVVYMAEQQEPVRRRVALKVI